MDYFWGGSPFPWTVVLRFFILPGFFLFFLSYACFLCQSSLFFLSLTVAAFDRTQVHFPLPPPPQANPFFGAVFRLLAFPWFPFLLQPSRVRTIVLFFCLLLGRTPFVADAVSLAFFFVEDRPSVLGFSGAFFLARFCYFFSQ